MQEVPAGNMLFVKSESLDDSKEEDLLINIQDERNNI